MEFIRLDDLYRMTAYIYLKRYPGLCMQCGSRICVCPAVPLATIGRMAKEIDISAEEQPFFPNPAEFADAGRVAAQKAFESVGGYPGLAAMLPFDRGDANHALVHFCMKMAKAIEEANPELAGTLRSEAIRLGDSAGQAGTTSKHLDVGHLLRRLRLEWKNLDEETKQSITSTGGLIGDLGEILSRFRILFVLSNPDESQLLRLHNEQRAIEEAIALAGRKQDFILVDAPAAQRDDLRRKLLDGDYDIVHFAGHADKNGLVFHAEGGGDDHVTLDALADVIAQYNSIKCVVLNACESIRSLVTPISPITIGMDESIDDDAAIAFSRGFYDGLAARKDFERAFEEGKNSVKMAGYDSDMIKIIRR